MAAFLRFELTRSLRNVRFLVFIAGFPVLLYLVYAKQHGISQGLTVAALLMVSMAVWSGMGSAMFATGPQLARERQNGWMRQLRVSPISAPRWFGAKLIQGLLLIVPGFALLLALGYGYGHVHLPASRLGVLAAVLLLGVIPFCALGLVIGLLFDGQTAQVAQLLTMLLMAFLGGIFIQWSSLPHAMQLIGKALPSYHLAQLGWNAAAGRALGVTDMLVLLAWAAAAGGVAIWRWRRESTTA
ncbi:MAG TPA: ABC transporter permease [Streptosporangiaceae bacterium]